MARCFQASRRSPLSTFSSTLFNKHPQLSSLHPHNNCNKSISSRISQAAQRSPLESNILRILRNEVVYQSEYAPPHQPITKFNKFMVEDRPGEQWITLRGKGVEDEDIKIEATMFDGSVFVPKSGNAITGEDSRLHISLLVDITKGEGSDQLEFVCSAWSDRLEIQKAYIFKHGGSSKLPYIGPNIKDLNGQLQKELYGFLRTRGVNDDLSVFLHEYMMNKDRIELIQWFRKVESIIKNQMNFL